MKVAHKDTRNEQLEMRVSDKETKYEITAAVKALTETVKEQLNDFKKEITKNIFETAEITNSNLVIAKIEQDKQQQNNTLLIEKNQVNIKDNIAGI
jgi:hypothetical protein